MIPTTPSSAPDRARQPIGTITNLACRKLRIEAEDVPPTDAAADPGPRPVRHVDLLRRHAPSLVILPDIADGAANPYPNGKNDYHPHGVEVYLDRVGSVRQVPRGLLGQVNVIVTAAAYVAAIAPVYLALLGWSLSTILLSVAVAAALIVPSLLVARWYRFDNTPRDRTALAEVAKVGNRGAGLAMTVFMPPVLGSPALAWKQYREALARNGEERVVYGRVRQVGGLTVLQYWLFYYYNDWWNRHEADWEVVMVYLGANDAPVAVACSSHLAGYWRRWGSVEHDEAMPDHPMVYVARGSHALYFTTAKGVHDAVLHQPWGIFDLRGQLTVHGKQDAVGRASLGEDSYRLEVMPENVDDIGSEAFPWDKWWWLRFAGRWGATDGILSPAIQEGRLRWDRPVEWACATCEADSGSWGDVVDAIAGARLAPEPVA